MRVARDCVCVVVGVALKQLLGPYLHRWRHGRGKAAADAQQQPKAQLPREGAASGPKQQPAANGHVVPELVATTSTATAAPQQQGGLILDRPLVTFDLETTGLDVGRDRIVEIAAVKLLPGGEVIVKGPQRINPGRPIPPMVTELHGIGDAEVAAAPRWEEVAQEWREFLEGCILHGYNAKRFDIPVLRSEFRRVGIFNTPQLGTPVLDSFRIFAQFEQRNLASALRFFCGRTLCGAHGALADAQAAQDVLLAEVLRYPELPRSSSGLAMWCSRPSRAGDATWDGRLRWQGGELVFNFGRHQNTSLRVVVAERKDYLLWMKGQDFSDEVMILVELALLNKLPENQEAWEAMLEDGSWQAAIEPEPLQAGWAVPV